MVLFLYKNILTKTVMIHGGKFWRIVNQERMKGKIYLFRMHGSFLALRMAFKKELVK